MIDCWLQLCTPNSGMSISLNALLKKQSTQFICKQTLNCNIFIFLDGPLIRRALHCGVNLFNIVRLVIQYVPETENRACGGVNVAYRASSCGRCVVFAHRLVPQQLKSPRECRWVERGDLLLLRIVFLSWNLECKAGLRYLASVVTRCIREKKNKGDSD